eukprot:11053318-Karenia_brevis.AAC.1
MDELLRQAWLPIFAKFSEKPEPAWTEFHERFRAQICFQEMAVSDITGDELQAVLKRMSGSAGMDGWRVEELRCLPLPLLNALAAFFNL